MKLRMLIFENFKQTLSDKVQSQMGNSPTTYLKPLIENLVWKEIFYNYNSMVSLEAANH